jgi:predicted nucleic acid-binding protein
MDPRHFPGIKVFIDTSVLIAGLASVTGGSASVLDLGEAGVIKLVISRQVLVEADRNVTTKLPRMVDRFRRFIRRLSPVIVDDPSPAEIQAAALVIHIKDAPILAAAKKAQVDFLITLDKKHFLSGKTGIRGRFKIVTPGEFLQTFERLYLERPDQD